MFTTLQYEALRIVNLQFNTESASQFERMATKHDGERKTENMFEFYKIFSVKLMYCTY